MDLPTRTDLLAIARTYIRTRAAKIDPNQVDTIGSDVNLFVGAMSVVANELVNQLAGQVLTLLIDGAEGEDLDRLAWDRYRETRKAASPSITSVVFSRLTNAAGAGAVLLGTRIQNDTGVEFMTTQVANLGATDLTAAAVTVQSVQAGSANKSDHDTIKRIVDIGPLWDKTLSVTNPTATAYGNDAETDEQFRARLHNLWVTARRGTLTAIEQGALETPGVASASAVEELSASAQPARLVMLYLADEDGLSDVNVTVDLEEWRAGGIQVLKVHSIPEYVDIVLRLTFQAGKQTTVLTEAIRTAILGTVNRCAVNGTLYRAALLETLKSFTDDGLKPSNDSIVEPTGDLVPTVGKTIRTTVDRITVL